MIHTRNRTHKPYDVLAPIVLTIGCVIAAIAIGAPNALAQIPPAVRSSPQPPADVIKTHLDKAIKLLMSEKASEQKAGRDLITNEMTNTGPNNAGFVFAYAQELNNQIGPALQSPNMRVRLNAAVAVARVAEKSETTKLLPSVMTILNDQHEAVALWGLKASRFLIVRALAENNTQLVPAIVTTGTKHPTDTVAAYDALLANNPPPTVLPALVAATQDLLEARLKQYQTGVPGEPAADMTGALHLSDTAWWKAHPNPTSQARTIQALVNLAAFASQRLNGAPPDVQEQLKLLVGRAAQAIIACAIANNHSELQQTLQQARQVTPRYTNEQAAASAATIFPAASAVFPGLKAPATVPGGTALPAPTTQPK